MEPNPDTFLFFPSWAWDEIFWCKYLAFTQDEHDHWTRSRREAVPDEDLWPLPEPWQTQLESSWERLFDADLLAIPWYAEPASVPYHYREAVLIVLRLKYVRKATPFLGCNKRRC